MGNWYEYVRSTVEELLAGPVEDEVLTARLDTLREPLPTFPGVPTWDAPAYAQGVIGVIDVMGAFTFVHASDPSECWNRAAVLSRMNRYSEAALEFVNTVHRIDSALARGGGEPDWPQWRDVALVNAIELYLVEGMPVTAAVLCRDVRDPKQRESSVSAVREALTQAPWSL